MPNDESSVNRHPTLRGRVLLLGLCIVAGCVVGAIGRYVSGDSAWFMAVPAFIAVGWLFVADPTRCRHPGR